MKFLENVDCKYPDTKIYTEENLENQSEEFIYFV